MKNKPEGILKTDTLKNCFKRADFLSNPDGSCYSGILCGNKDLRRIVLLVREIRENRKLLNQLMHWSYDNAIEIPENIFSKMVNQTGGVK